MSTREKTITLYSRNGIRILKTENLQNNRQNKKWCFDQIEKVNVIDKAEHNQKTGEYVQIKHESPLGFYYYTRKWVDYDTIKSKGVTYKKYTIWLDTTKYELEYPIKYEAPNIKQEINIEMRPWDIMPGYKGMPDNMINALVLEVNKFIDIIFEYNNIIKNSWGITKTPEQYKKSIMIDIFGYEDGPKIQSNDIKILAHGFDLKESFRKRKEQ